MGTKTAITPDDLIHMPRPENGKHYELSQGELIVVGNAGMLHEILKNAILRLMIRYELNHPGVGRIFSETQFTLANNGARIPDVAFVGPAKVAQLQKTNQAVPFAPDIAIEVISESETASYSETKVQEYLAGGVAEVWQFYPKQEFVRIHDAHGVRELSGAALLQSPLLPGFEVQVSQVFASDL